MTGSVRPQKPGRWLAIASLLLLIASSDGLTQYDLDSKKKFGKTYYSKWIITRSLMHGFEAIYWVFLSTQRHTPLLSLI